MAVTDVRKDPDNLTLTVTSRFDASVDRVWQVWADPRTLERWWGPPTYPATVVDHDLSAGGRVTYYMTSPEGEKYHGYWDVIASEPPHSLDVLDGFADDSGAPNDAMPRSTFRVDLKADGSGTVMTVVSTFESAEAMETLVSMGMVEGITLAMGQIDALLA